MYAYLRSAAMIMSSYRYYLKLEFAKSDPLRYPTCYMCTHRLIAHSQ